MCSGPTNVILHTVFRLSILREPIVKTTRSIFVHSIHIQYAFIKVKPALGYWTKDFIYLQYVSWQTQKQRFYAIFSPNIENIEQLFHWAERLSQQEILPTQLVRYTFIKWTLIIRTAKLNPKHIHKNIKSFKNRWFRKNTEDFFWIDYMVWNRCWRRQLWFLFYFSSSNILYTQNFLPNIFLELNFLSKLHITAISCYQSIGSVPHQILYI